MEKGDIQVPGPEVIQRVEEGLEPRIDASCPRCGNDRATWAMVQTDRRGDEPSARFFRCTRCGHTGGRLSKITALGAVTAAFDPVGNRKVYADTDLPFAAPAFYMGLGDWQARTMQWSGTFSGTGIYTLYDMDAGAGNIHLNVVSSERSWSPPTYDRSALLKKPDPDGKLCGGYMWKPSDWRDVEITCYATSFRRAAAIHLGGTAAEATITTGPHARSSDGICYFLFKERHQGKR
jgi:hypothetical protein